MQEPVILLLAGIYVGVLFTVAYYADERETLGRSITGSPYVYALSLGVYCTAWTFYGSVGRAATTGVGFLPIYLGPTLVFLLGWVVLRKVVRICRYHRITSIADFIGSRYGKSTLLAGSVAAVAVVGVVPYIALQVKAIAVSYAAITGSVPQDGGMIVGEWVSGTGAGSPFWTDPAFWMALALAGFTILFGTRHLDATERHEGIVAAIAFESIVKLVAFLVVGSYVVFVLYDGPGDLFSQGAAVPSIRDLYTLDAATADDWFWLLGLSMIAILMLPRQFQVTVVENVDEEHLRTASWLFPLYLFAINLFVLPIAVAGLLAFGSADGADAFVLTLPLAHGQEALAILVFLGGFSAATGMVIVATTALSTMISNDLVMPVLLRIPALRLAERKRLTGLILAIRRISIAGVVLLAYGYLRAVGGSYSLASIGLISFAAVAQFAPAFLGGMYWKRATRSGALAGLVAGLIVWGYTLPLPTLAETNWLSASFVADGPWGADLLRPHALLGLETLSPVAHGFFWSLLANAGLYVGVSLFTRPRLVEQSQAVLFVDVFRYAGSPGRSTWKGTAPVAELRQLLQRFLGWRRTQDVLQAYAERHDLDPERMEVADEGLVHHVEKVLAGVIGTASARGVVASVVTEQPLRIGEVMDILDEAQQVMAYSRELEHKKTELEETTRELAAANAKLKRVDSLKDDFVSTVTHELRTPLTAIRAISEILSDNPDLDPDQRREFLATILREGERLTRLVNQVLDLQRLDAGPPQMERLDLCAVTRHAVTAMQQQLETSGLSVSTSLPNTPVEVDADRDRMMQVLLNLLSNAGKFADRRVAVSVQQSDAEARVLVADDGPGIPRDEQDAIFEKFHQADGKSGGQPGSGLGLAIAMQIVHQHDGTMRVDSSPGEGATFTVRLPTASTAAPLDETSGDGAQSDSAAASSPAASSPAASDSTSTTPSSP